MHYLKNSQLDVEIKNTGVRFRNPVHFISMVDQDLRDMHYETKAVIDTFFHHPSHPPFLAIRMIQRFGISNPSPGFIERVAIAYATGSYKNIGSGNYGDMSALYVISYVSVTIVLSTLIFSNELHHYFSISL